jgi:hypothetical protein
MNGIDPRTPVFAVFQCLDSNCGALRPLFERVNIASKGHRRVYRCIHCGAKGNAHDLDNPMRLREFERTFKSWNQKLAEIAKGD